MLAPLGRHLLVGSASRADAGLSGDALWLGSGQAIGLSVGGVAHLIPEQVGRALRAVVHLVSRGVLREPGALTSVGHRLVRTAAGPFAAAGPPAPGLRTASATASAETAVPTSASGPGRSPKATAAHSIVLGGVR